MLQRVVRFVLADLTRPWGPWAKLCVAGCASSVAFMEISGRTFHAAKYLWADFLSLCVLLASFLAGIVALTREGTSKGVPLVVPSRVRATMPARKDANKRSEEHTSELQS